MSFSKDRFLLDENVRAELGRFLREKGCDVKIAQKGSSDTVLAQLSLEEKRVFVTNDADFTEYSKDEIFSLVWLRIPQHDSATLLDSFEKLLGDSHMFKGNLVILWPGKLDISPLGEVI